MYQRLFTWLALKIDLNPFTFAGDIELLEQEMALTSLLKKDDRFNMEYGDQPVLQYIYRS